MPNPVRALLGSAAGAAHARLELFGTEVREELSHFSALLLGGCAAILLGALTLAAAAAAVVIAAGEYRLPAILALAVLCAAAAAVLVQRLRFAAAARPRPFSRTLAELERDREALLAGPHGERSNMITTGQELTRLVSIGLFAYSIGKRLRGVTT